MSIPRGFTIDGDIAYIPLQDSTEKYCIVDADDAVSVGALNWYLQKRGCAASRIDYSDVKMHHYLAGKPPDGMVTDHINRNPLDNRRSNLRVTSQHSNSFNCVKKSKSSVYKGVSWHKRDQKWRSTLMFDGKQIYHKVFATEIEAAKAYDIQAEKYFGEFAYLNFPK